LQDEHGGLNACGVNSAHNDGGGSKRGLTRSLTNVFAVTAYAGLLNFVVLIYFVRTLGPTPVALYAATTLGIELAVLMLNFGFNQALVYHGRSGNTLLPAVLYLTAAQSLAISAATGVVWLVYMAIDQEGAQVLLGPGSWILLARLMGIWGNVALAPLEVDFRYSSVSAIRASAATAGAFTGVVAAHHYHDVFAFVLRDLAAAVVSLTAAMATSKFRVHFKIDSAAIRAVLQYGHKTWALNVLERAALRLEYLVVAAFLGRELLGIYFAIRSIVEGFLGFMVTPIQTVLFAHYCRTRSASSLRPQLALGLPVTLGVAAVCYALGFLFGDALATLLLGLKYRHAAQAIGGLAFYAICMIWFENVKVLSMSRDMHVAGVPARLAQLAVLLVATPVAAHRCGLTGVGASVALAALLPALIATRLLAKMSGSAKSN
jgi:O-antigen/teichoic acid export membrane protein